jgi:hypothetical protein
VIDPGLITPFVTAAAASVAHHRTTARIIGIVFVIIGGFTFTFRRALVARDPDGAPRYARTVGPVSSGVFAIVGLILIIAG